MSSSQSDDLFQNTDEYSDTRNLQRQNTELRLLNNHLIKELNSIKAQFNEATAVKDQMQKIYDTNAKLAADLRKIKSEKEEFEGRLKCNIESLNKKREEMEIEKREIEQRAQRAIEETRNICNKGKAELKEQLQELNQKNVTLQTTVKVQNAELDTLRGSCQRALVASRTCFLMPFKNLDQLTEYLLKMPEKTDAKEQTPSNNKPADSELKDKICKLKQKLKLALKGKKDAEGKLAKAQQTFNQNKITLESKNHQLESKLNETQHKLEVVELQKNQYSSNADEQIASLKKSIENQKEIIEEYRKQLDINRSFATSNASSFEKTNFQSSSESKNGKIKNLQSTIMSLKQQNSMLLNQMKENDNIKESLRKQNQSLHDENMQCTTEIKRLKDVNKALSNENASLHEEIDILQEQNHILSSSLNQVKNGSSDLQTQNDKLRSSFNLLDISMNKQKQEIEDLVNERTIYIEALKKQSMAMQALEESLATTTDDYKNSQKKVLDLSKELREIKMNPKFEEIPETSWFCIDLPKHLSNQIIEIANGPAPTTTKLRHVLSLIAKYYNSELEKLSSSLNIAGKQNDDIAEKIQHVFTALSAIIKDVPTNYQDFVSNPATEKQLLQAISDLHDSQIDLKVSNIKYNNLLNEIASKIHANGIQDIEPAFQRFVDQANNIIKQLNEEKSIKKKLKRALRNAKASIENERNQIQENEKSQISMIENLKEEKKQLMSEISELQSKVVKLEVYMKQSESPNIPYHVDDSHHEHLISYAKQMDDQKLQYVQQIEEKDEYLRKATKKIEKLEKELSQWKRTSEIMKNAKSEKDMQYLALATKMEENSQELQREREEAINELKTEYEKLINEIKQKNKNLKLLIDQTNDSLNTATTQNRTISKENAILIAENQQLKTELDSLQDEHRREKQLTDAKIKAVDLSNETQRLLDIENVRAKFDEEKRSLFEFVALNFHHLFDANEELSNETFKILIEKASRELQKYIRQEATIRRLLGIKQNETPEEAISKLLLSMYQQ